MLAQVMYSGQPKDHAGGSLEAMQANVRGIKEHPAILGYYMCATAARQRACCCSLCLLPVNSMACISFRVDNVFVLVQLR